MGNSKEHAPVNQMRSEHNDQFTQYRRRRRHWPFLLVIGVHVGIKKEPSLG